MRGFIDSGWLFLISGATIVAAATIIPPADDLTRLQSDRDELRVREIEFLNRLSTYADFQRAIEESDPDLVRRLAAAHLNLIPEGSVPLAMIGDELDASVERWIDNTLPAPRAIEPPEFRDSLLRRMSTGPSRLWTYAFGASLVFFGLLPRSRAQLNEPHPAGPQDVRADSAAAG